MLSPRRAVGAIVVSCVIAATSAAAQTPAPKSEPSSVSQSASQTAEEVKTWSRKKWNAAKAEYAKDTAKWAGCRKMSKDKKLSGKESWSFLYDCMKS